MPNITLDQWQQISTLLVPFIVAFVVQSHWKSAYKRAIAVGLAVIAAVVPELIQHKVNSANIVTEALIVVGVSQGFYHIFKAKFDTLSVATDTVQPATPTIPVRPPGA